MNGTAWITGGRGFIGRHLAAMLARRGREVHGIGHGTWLDEDRQRCGVGQWVNSSVTAAGLDALAARASRPSTVFHLAGGSSVGASLAAPREDLSRTVDATAELLEWLRTRSPVTRLVAVSSAAVYGDSWRGPIPVDAPLRPCSPYGAHKAAMELLLCGHARSFDLRVAIVRLFSVYGPGLEKQLIWDLCTRLARDNRGALGIGGTGEERRDFLHVEDAVAMLAAAEARASIEPAVFNGGTGRARSVRELAEALLSAWPATATLSFNGQRRAGDPADLVADLGGGSLLEHEPVDLAAGLAATVAAARLRLGAN